jgi:hypothetical protein
VRIVPGLVLISRLPIAEIVHTDKREHNHYG